ARQTAMPYQPPARVGPALSPLSMSRIALRSADLARAGNFYGKLFGTEVASAASSRSRAFGVGDATLELVAAVGAGARELASIATAVTDFTLESASRVLRERGIKMETAAGTVRIADPDGLPIELAAA